MSVIFSLSSLNAWSVGSYDTFSCHRISSFPCFVYNRCHCNLGSVFGFILCLQVHTGGLYESYTVLALFYLLAIHTHRNRLHSMHRRHYEVIAVHLCVNPLMFALEYTCLTLWMLSRYSYCCFSLFDPCCSKVLIEWRSFCGVCVRTE